METVPDDELLTVRSLHILVVEDNMINQLVLKKMLEGVGHKIEIASNGQEACDFVAEKRYDLIIMDVHMPVMDGIEATKAIRESGSDTPILGCTADTFPDEIDKFKTLGMDGVVAKPIHLHNLLVSINTVVGEEIHLHSDGRKLVAPLELNFT